MSVIWKSDYAGRISKPNLEGIDRKGKEIKFKMTGNMDHLIYATQCRVTEMMMGKK